MLNSILPRKLKMSTAVPWLNSILGRKMKVSTETSSPAPLATYQVWLLHFEVGWQSTRYNLINHLLIIKVPRNLKIRRVHSPNGCARSSGRKLKLWVSSPTPRLIFLSEVETAYGVSLTELYAPAGSCIVVRLPGWNGLERLKFVVGIEFVWV